MTKSISKPLPKPVPKSMSGMIFRTVLVVVLATIMVCTMLMGWMIFSSFEIKEYQELRRNLDIVGAALPNVGDRSAYIASLGTDELRVTWISADGKVLFDSTVDDASTLENHAERPEVAEAQAGDTGQSSRYSQTLGEVMFYSTMRLDDNTVLRLSSSQNSVFAALQTLVLPGVLVLVCAAIIIGLSARIAAQRFVQPINALDLNDPLKNSTYSELNPLLQRLNEQRISLEVQIDEAANRRREFTANVSHELKTPLTVISGYAELIKTGVAKPEDTKYFSELIYDEAGHMRELVEDILVISQLEEDAVATSSAENVTDVALAPLIHHIVERLQPFALQHDVSFEVTIADPSLSIRGSKNVLTEIIYNLSENAIRYNKAGGVVRIALRASDSTVYVAVEDTGIGIAPDYQEKVFERFFCVDKSRSRATGGTGLGLAIVKHGAQYHNAAIRLQSELDIGTTLTLEFPR